MIELIARSVLSVGGDRSVRYQRSDPWWWWTWRDLLGKPNDDSCGASRLLLCNDDAQEHESGWLPPSYGVLPASIQVKSSNSPRAHPQYRLAERRTAAAPSST